MRFDRSRQLHQRAQGVMPGGNTRSSVYESPFPIYAESGRGAYFQDVDGNRYLDFTNNFTTLIHGHGDETVATAVAAQLRRGTSFGNPSTGLGALSTPMVAADIDRLVDTVGHALVKAAA